jgi:hypothetical protein
MSTIIGIDNGSTGSVGIIRDGAVVHFGPVPTQPFLHYGKKGTISNRLDRAAFRGLLLGAVPCVVQTEHDFVTDRVLATSITPTLSAVRVYIERPFTGGAMMIKSMLSSARFFEATIIALEDMGLGYEVIDSGTWQKPVLGAVTGSKELKLASKLRGLQLCPQFKDAITKQGDADGLLISHYFSRQP